MNQNIQTGGQRNNRNRNRLRLQQQRRKRKTENLRRVNAPLSTYRPGMAATRYAFAPNAYGTITSTIGPSMRGGTTMVLKNREMVRKVEGTTLFSSASLRINPSNADLFPWASSIAKSYERYRVISCRFDYVPSCATSTAGTVSFGIDYDVNDPVPATMTEICQNWGSTTGNAWSPFSTTVDPIYANRGTQLFTGYSAIDPTAHDAGHFIVAAEGMAGGATIGYLFADYAFELYLPQLQNPPDGLVQGETNTATATKYNWTITGDKTQLPISPLISDITYLVFQSAFEGLVGFLTKETASVTRSTPGFSSGITVTDIFKHFDDVNVVSADYRYITAPAYSSITLTSGAGNTSGTARILFNTGKSQNFPSFSAYSD